jgi:hypothetical protein
MNAGAGRGLSSSSSSDEPLPPCIFIAIAFMHSMSPLHRSIALPISSISFGGAAAPPGALTALGSSARAVAPPAPTDAWSR